MMKQERALEIFRCLNSAGVPFWVDGGWGVDVLLGGQSRDHSDLDLAIAFEDLSRCKRALEPLGYDRADCHGDAHWNWVLADRHGGSVDLHGFVLDAQGNAVLGDPASDALYPAGALNGIGTLSGMTLACIAAPYVLGFRNGFAPRDVDRHDVAALCARFGLALPSRFR